MKTAIELQQNEAGKMNYYQIYSEINQQIKIIIIKSLNMKKYNFIIINIYQGCFNMGKKYLKENMDIILGFGLTLMFSLVSYLQKYC